MYGKRNDGLMPTVLRRRHAYTMICHKSAQDMSRYTVHGKWEGKFSIFHSLLIIYVPMSILIDYSLPSPVQSYELYIILHLPPPPPPPPPQCNNPCGYGTQTRRIRCRYVANNHRANESCCEGLEVPERTRPCYDTRGSKCKPEWVTHPYGQVNIIKWRPLPYCIYRVIPISVVAISHAVFSKIIIHSCI